MASESKVSGLNSSHFSAATTLKWLYVTIGMFSAPLVAGHGYMEQPKARQFCILNSRGHLLAPAHSGHGAYGMKKPKGGFPGPCGDPFGNNRGVRTKYKDQTCDPVTTYTEGQWIEVKIAAMFRHGGHFEFRMCPKRNGGQDCYDEYPLITQPHNQERWWMLAPTNGKDVATPEDPDYHIIQVKLPEGVSCPDGCGFQWAWFAGHQCIYRCRTEEGEQCGEYANGFNPIVRPEMTFKFDICPDRRPGPGEEPQTFVNCADIRILAKDGSGSDDTDDKNTNDNGNDDSNNNGNDDDDDSNDNNGSGDNGTSRFQEEEEEDENTGGGRPDATGDESWKKWKYRNGDEGNEGNEGNEGSD